MNIISNDGINKLNRIRKARLSYKLQRTINASLNSATRTRAVTSNANFVTRQKIKIIFDKIQNGTSLNELNRGHSGLETYGLFFFSSRRRHTRLQGDWSSDVCSSD